MTRAPLLLLVGCFAIAQATGQPCPQYARLMEAGEKFQTAKKYKEALNKFNAAKLCDPAKARDAATAANRRAERATTLARQQAQEAQALYWASESDKLEPGKAAGLLMEADRKAPAIRPVQERLVRRRNELPSFAEEFGLVKSYQKDAAPFFPNPAFSPDGRKLLISSYSYHPLILYNVPRPDEPEALFGPQDLYPSATFSANGRRVLATLSHGPIRVWDVENPEAPLATFRPAGRNQVKSALFSPDGRWVLHASADSTAKIWDVARPDKPQVLFSATREIISGAFSPSRRYVALQFYDSLRVYHDDAFSAAVAVFPGNTLIHFSRNDDLLAVARNGTVATWWRPSNWTSPAAVSEPSVPIQFASLSPDSRWVLTGHNTTLQIWELPPRSGSNRPPTLACATNGQVHSKNKPEMTLPLPKLYNSSALFSPDGGKIVTLTDQSGVGGVPLRLGYLTVEHPRAWLRANPGKIVPLSDEERLQYSLPK